MFVLSYVLPPEGGAKYGKARVMDPVPYLARAAKTEAVRVLMAYGVPEAEAKRFGLTLSMKDTGTEWVNTETGLRFRIDRDDRAPNACPCCGRLVLFGDHAFAGTEDAYCDGCYTWATPARSAATPTTPRTPTRGRPPLATPRT